MGLADARVTDPGHPWLVRMMLPLMRVSGAWGLPMLKIPGRQKCPMIGARSFDGVMLLYTHPAHNHHTGCLRADLPDRPGLRGRIIVACLNPLPPSTDSHKSLHRPASYEEVCKKV